MEAASINLVSYMQNITDPDGNAETSGWNSSFIISLYIYNDSDD